MKKVFEGIKKFLSAAIGIALLIFCSAFALFILPFDYLEYKTSLYYKKERKKYSLFAAAGNHFEMYNEILKHRLPIRYVENPNNTSLECGWFVLEDILLLSDQVGFEYDEKNDVWQYSYEEDEQNKELLTLDEYISEEINTVNQIAGQQICKYAVVLMDASSNCGQEKSNADKRLLFYNDNRPNVLKKLCENPMNWRV